MKTIELKKGVLSKLGRGVNSFYEKDIEKLSRSFTPGEWVSVQGENITRLGFINTQTRDNQPILNLIPAYLTPVQVEESESFIENTIKNLITRAVGKRKLLLAEENSYRLFYGVEDGLFGLIADKYGDKILLQINSAGIDRYREFIKTALSEIYPQSIVLFWDQSRYRQAEGLPCFEKELEKGDLEFSECGLNYSIPSNLAQKVGYYFDHRENRQSLENFLNKFGGPKKKGLDLFCYVGSWGLHLLRSGVLDVTFVDQGNFESVVSGHIEQNEFSGRGRFVRSDVFNLLDEEINRGEKYDIIASDPPAFAKSQKDKKTALRGYSKLHTKMMKLTQPNGIISIGSCTSCVSLIELDETVQRAATLEGKKVTLLDIGMQGFDHPVTSLSSKANYIKHLIYFVET
ncbi:MAG: class I SAM-dependent rRNA methyltransferase [Bacteriovoracaceae bacterium]|nr:class I SAM-dependent rRNA methyltransferase [Bacteriovoracaceae bacterium]